MTPEDLLRELGISSAAQIDLEVIAMHCGAEIQYKRLHGCDARIVGHGDRAVLTVDVRATRERQRFSIAHELGHWTLHRGQLMMCRADEIESAQTGHGKERDADAFAAALLMPNYLFKPAAIALSAKEPWTQVATLASEFRTSLLATALRLVSLGIWPGWLMCYNRNGRQWFRRAPALPFEAFPRADLDPRSAAFDLAYGSSGAPKPRKVAGDTWFDTFGAERRMLLEHARGYGANSVLCLVRQA